MPRKKTKVEAGLKAKGFEQNDSNHRYFIYMTLEGKKSAIKTMTSHTPKMKDIPNNLIGQMAKQCQLSKQKFLDLIDCPLSREEYDSILKKQIT